MNDKHSVIEFYHLPGLGTKEEATVIHTGTVESCDSLVARLRRVNAVFQDGGYRYEVHPVDAAGAVVKAANTARDRDLAEFRHRVYGEPMPA
jgi:hypothetical protein